MKTWRTPNRGHVFLRELGERPSAIRKTIDTERGEVGHVARLLERRRIHFLGMGSSYYASLYGTYLLADLTQRTAQNHIASEFVHYPSAIGTDEIGVTLSQSGETVETVEAVRLLKKRGNLVIGVTNEPSSTLANLSDRVLITHADTERASSTKTFAATLAVVYCLIVALAARSKRIDERKKDLLIDELLGVSRNIDTRLAAWNNDAKTQSSKFANCRAVMVLARGPTLPAALQGALLFKEVAKIPAEGMSSGEFAHGPVEILSRQISVVILGGGRTSKLQYQLALRTKSLHSSYLMIIPGANRIADSIYHGEMDENLAVFPSAAILELLVYHTALKKRLNPDGFRVIQKVTTRE